MKYQIYLSSNIAPEYANIIKQHAEFVMEPVVAPNLCRGLKRERVSQSIASADAVISAINETNNCVGFATLKMDTITQTMTIDVICAEKGVGSHLMNTIELIAKDASFAEIKLESVTDAVGFYLKNGFSCDKLCKMKKIIGAQYYGGLRSKKSARCKNKIKNKRNKTKRLKLRCNTK